MSSNRYCTLDFGFCFCPLLLTEELLSHPLGRGTDQLSVQNRDSVLLLSKPRGRVWKKENMLVVDLAGISTIDAIPATGFITLAQFRRTNLNSVLHADGRFSLIPLMLPLILPRDCSPPPVHLSPQAHQCSRQAAYSRGNIWTKLPEPGRSLPLLPLPAPLSQAVLSLQGASIWPESVGKN